MVEVELASAARRGARWASAQPWMVGARDALPVRRAAREALPAVWIGHDRRGHAERQALLRIVAGLLARRWEHDACGRVALFVSHTPCVSCLLSLRAFQLRFPGVALQVDFEPWEITAKWAGDSPEAARPPE